MASKLRVAIRVDASRQIGTGHLRRCAALADAIRELDGEVFFVSRPKDVDVASLVTDGLLQMAALEPPAVPFTSYLRHAAWLGTDMVSDATEAIQIMAEIRPNLVVVDHYGIDSVWHNLVREKLGCTILAIDDLGDRQLAVDILIDHNWHSDHRQKYAGLIPENCKVLCGPQYALLGEKYAAASKYQFHEDVRSIGIFMGGADQENSTKSALRAVRAAGFFGPIEVVTTSANPNLSDLLLIEERDPALTISINLQDLTLFFASHDLQIGAGGGATWERFCLGAPSIILGYAENHDSVLEPIQDLQIASVVSAGWTDAMLTDRIRQLIIDSPQRRIFAINCRKLVDGKGASRLARELIGSYEN